MTSAAEAPGERFRSEPQGAPRRPRRRSRGGSKEKRRKRDEGSLARRPKAAATPPFHGTSCTLLRPPRERIERYQPAPGGAIRAIGGNSVSPSVPLSVSGLRHNRGTVPGYLSPPVSGSSLTCGRYSDVNPARTQRTRRMALPGPRQGEGERFPRSHTPSSRQAGSPPSGRALLIGVNDGRSYFRGLAYRLSMNPLSSKACSRLSS